MEPLGEVILLVVIVLSLWDPVSGGDCPKEYLRFSKKHTFCLPPNESCDIISRGLDQKDKDELLSLQNECRSHLAKGQEKDFNLPAAGNMLQLVWDEELAKVAQAHADQCSFDHDCKPCRRSRQFEVGQNIHKSEIDDAPEKKFKEAIQSWYKEVKNFNLKWIKKYIPFASKGPVGHFSQLAWAMTWRVGCGYVAFRGKPSNYEITVCNYGPGGNYLEQPTYIEGKPCSACPESTCCGSSCSKSPNYDGLCQILGDKGPHYVHPTQNIKYHCDFSEDCHLVTPAGMKPWKIIDTLSGKYYSIVLEGGESSEFTVGKPMVGKRGTCLVTAYKKGPDVAGSGGKNLAYLNFGFIGMRMKPKIPLQDSDTLMVHNMQLKFPPRPFKLSISFSVPKDSPAQFFEILEFYVKTSGCDE